MMKYLQATAVVWLGVFLLPSVAQTPSGRGFGLHLVPKDLPAATRDTTTDEQLRLRRQAEKFSGFAREPREKEVHEIEKHSEFIAAAGNVTLVPKGAVLHVPERFRKNLVTGLTGKFQPFHEFIGSNRALLLPFEVTLDEALGKKPVDETKLEIAKRSGRILVAVLNRNPISMLPPAPEPKASAR